ncbi:MAG: hypothetical protein O3A80_04430 [bacterium]|nr:hypothetical protein [bacterium]MDA1293068.1 hypothetical protein [bacterium]
MPPKYFELIFILALGALQPVVEMLFGTQIATYYNGIAIIVVLAYVLLLIQRSSKSVWKTWGFRLDTLRASIAPYALFSLAAIVILYMYGWYKGNTPLPIGFWYVLAVYPLWGLAQQFVLQNFVARNLATLIPSRMYRSLATAIIFACAHIPSVALFTLAFIAGFVFTYLHSRYYNLLTLSIAHGILGALVFHLVLGQDQWKILAEYF